MSYLYNGVFQLLWQQLIHFEWHNKKFYISIFLPLWPKDFLKFFLSFYVQRCTKTMLPQMVDLYHILHSDWPLFKYFCQDWKHLYTADKDQHISNKRTSKLQIISTCRLLNILFNNIIYYAVIAYWCF